jgi:tRNA(fMet)-specific endonuclease VapC
MLVLDTDHVCLLQHADSPLAGRIRARLAASAEREVVTTIVTAEEQLRGWLGVISTAKRPDQLAAAYARLGQLLENYRRVPLLDFDTAAADEYTSLLKRRLRVPTMDLRIAAITMAHRGTLLTRNRKDFARIPGLDIEDWTL